MSQRKAFALRLYAILCERYGNPAPFERLKAELVRQKAKTRESTIRGWLPPLERLRSAPDGADVRPQDWSGLRTPDLPPLVEVSRVLDVSIDHLLGAAVPRRLTDREAHDNPGPSLLVHVVRNYLRRAKRQRRDGLAAVVGGRLSERQPTPPNPDYEAELADRRAMAVAKKTPFLMPPRSLHDWPKVGDALADGRIVTNRSVFGLQLLNADAKAFLERVCDQVFEEAEKWEDDHKESEREVVRQHVDHLSPNAQEIARAMVEGMGAPTTEADVLRRLLRACGDPLSPAAQTQIIAMGEQLRAYRQRRAQHQVHVKHLDAVIDEVLTDAFGPDESTGRVLQDPARDPPPRASA